MSIVLGSPFSYYLSTSSTVGIGAGEVIGGGVGVGVTIVWLAGVLEGSTTIVVGYEVSIPCGVVMCIVCIVPLVGLRSPTSVFGILPTKTR